MTSQDTEALKALLDAIRAVTALQPTVENKEFKIAKAARAAEGALERMLASQGEQREAQGEEQWRDKCWGAAQAAMSNWTGLTEQHRHEIATDVVHEFEKLAPPLAEPDVEGAVAAILRSYLSNYEGDPEVTAGIAAIIRRHMQQGK